MVQAHGKKLAAGPVPREEAPAKLSPELLRALVLNDVCWAFLSKAPRQHQLYLHLLGWGRVLWTQPAAHLSSSDFYAAFTHIPRAHCQPALLLPASLSVS